MCRNLSDELQEFDYRKEQELKQVFIEYAESRFDVFEKVLIISIFLSFFSTTHQVRIQRML